MVPLATSNFVLDPSGALILWTLAVVGLLCCGLATAIKGHRGWLGLGLLLGGLPWVYAATVLPTSDRSLLARLSSRRSTR